MNNKIAEEECARMEAALRSITVPYKRGLGKDKPGLLT
jgi:hypothetical protein